MAIRLYENFRALLYAPFFAAHALDAYAAEGVEVELKESPEPGLGARQVLAGNAELTWGGPMRVLLTHDQQPDCDLVCFCEAVGRDPFSLIGRTPRPGFRVADLAGLRLASVSEVPTPWLCLQDDLRRAGLDPATLDRIADRTMADNVAALAAGTVDVVQLFEPYASQAIEAGGHVWYEAADRGLTAYTCFFARRGMLEQRRAEFERVTRAMYRTQRWLHGEQPASIATRVAPFFPDLAHAALTRAIERYQAIGIWNRTPLLAQDGFDRLKGALLSGGLIRRGADYARCVDNGFATHAIADDPAAL